MAIKILTREQVWLSACTSSLRFGAGVKAAIFDADETLKAFDERFPRPLKNNI